MTTPGFSAKRALTRCVLLSLLRSMSSPPLVLAKVISRSVVMRPPALMSWPASMRPWLTSCCRARKASRKYSGSRTVGTSLPTLPWLWAKAEPPSWSWSKERSMWYRRLALLVCMTGDTIFLMSLTSPPALTMTVPGEITFCPSGYFCVMESESLPVGTLMWSEQQKSLRAFTAV